MQSTPNLRDADPHDVFVIEPDVSLAARADKAPLDVLYDVLSNPSSPRPADPAAQLRPDPELRIAPDFSAGAAFSGSVTAPSLDAAVGEPFADENPVAEDRPEDGRPDEIRIGDSEIGAHPPATGKFARGAVMALFALGSAVIAAAWQHYGDDAKAMMARYTPPFALASFASAEKPAPSQPAAPAAVETAAASQAVAQPAPAAADTAAPTAAAASPDPSQLIQSMARDLAAMGQQISELKASIEQIKASQPQTASAPARSPEARLAEPAARPRMVPPAAPAAVHAATTPVRKPKQVFPYAPIASASPPQQAAPAPLHIAPPVQAAEDGGPLVRPPMPLR